MVNLEELIMIVELHRQGLSVSAIAERTGHDFVLASRARDLTALTAVITQIGQRICLRCVR